MSIPLLVLAVIGLLMYALTNGKISEIGRIIFACALLGICLGGSTSAHWLRITS